MIQTHIQLETFYEALLPKGPESCLFLDIDDTLIHPTDAVFITHKENNPYAGFLDEYKEDQDLTNPETLAAYEDVLSAFRLGRQVKRVDDLWLSLFEAYQARGGLIIGLTKLDTGKVGQLESVERWRYAELQKLGYAFSALPHLEGEDPLVLEKGEGPFPATYHGGIIYTGSLKKSEALEAFMERAPLPLQTLLFVDDKKSNLEDVKGFCAQKGIGFSGFLYEQVKNLSADFDHERALFQVKYLFEHKVWLTDAEADKLRLQS